MSESRGESRFKNFSIERDNFFKQVRFKTGSINNDIGDNRRRVIEELSKDLERMNGEVR